MPRTYGTHGFCFVCKRLRREKNKLKSIPNKAVIDVFIETRILIPFDARLCQCHFDEFGMIKKEEINKIQIVKENIKLDAIKVICFSY